MLHAQMPEPVPDPDHAPIEEPPTGTPPAVEDPPVGEPVPATPVPDRLD